MKTVISKATFVVKYGFFPPPLWSDLSGYELLLDMILRKNILDLDGDIVEIGVFLGGGTYKLSKLLEKKASDKVLYAIDIFSSDFDKTICTCGWAMNEMYKSILKGRDQRSVYGSITEGCNNVVTLAEDSINVKLPCPKVAFAYVDGNHDPAYVRSDFYLVWNKLVSQGIISFDDYGYDLPQVTKAIDEIIKENRKNIKDTWTSGLKTIFIQKK